MAPGDSFVLDMLAVERLRLTAVDGDITGFIGVVRIESDTSNGGFGLAPTSTAGQWYIVVDDPELVGDLIDYTVVVSVNDQSCTEDRTVITITVTDALNPKFDEDPYEGDVPENAPANYPVIQVSAKNKDGNSEGIVYHIQTGSNQGLRYFQIDSRTGLITVKAGADIDAESVAEFALFVEATDTRLEPHRTGDTTVSIVVVDVNDRCPTFEISYYVGSMSLEDNFVQETDTDRLVLTALDKDITGFSGYAAIEIDSTGGGFALATTADPNKWNIRVANASRIVLGIHSLMVSVTDNTAIIPCGLDLSNVTIAVIDTDDMVPKFDQDTYESNVTESAMPGVHVIQVSATNKDGNSVGIVYRIKTGSNGGTKYFQIDPNTGEITVRDGGIDAELVLEFILFVEATDTRLEPQRSGIATVVITVRDINDQCPSFTVDMHRGLLEQGLTYVLSATSRLTVRAIDGDRTFNGTITIDSDSSGGFFELVQIPEANTDNIREWYLITTNLAIDVANYSIEVSVKDDWSLAIPPCLVDRTSIRVTVHLGYELPPSFEDDTYYGSVPEGANPGTFIVKVCP
ncbi:protocadherin Fat 4-like [Amphiura filiformis]|uniref:protocadherin Fat 4-like n=1 Tax=Amphiura filiformis TaxID=82378 RepID=UPI003B20DA44